MKKLMYSKSAQLKRKIGIDAYFLYQKHNTGIGSINFDIISELSKIDHVNNYFLYTPEVTHNSRANEILLNSNFQIKEVRGAFYRSRRLWLQSFGLRKQILSDNVNIFWGGGEYIPIHLPSKITTLCTIMDLVFILYPKTVSFVNLFFYKILFPLSKKRTSHFTTISNNSAKDLEDYLSIPPNKITTILCGINFDNYNCKPNPKKDNFILFVGTLQPRKNLENLLKAFEIIGDKIDEKLIIVGASGWKNDKIKHIIESIPARIKSKIIFKGYISSNEIIELYKKARLLVVPSLHEGFGLIIAEAMACGTPVVTSPTGAIPELFNDVPIYANPHSPIDISEKILSVLQDKILQKNMILKGKKFVKKYNIKDTALNFLKLLESL